MGFSGANAFGRGFPRRIRRGRCCGTGRHPGRAAILRFADDAQFIALLSDNGLTDVQVSTVAFGHDTDSADHLWEGMLTGTVRTSAFLLGQPEESRRRVRSTSDRLVLDYRRGETFEWPVSVKLATRPKGKVTWFTAAVSKGATSRVPAGAPSGSRTRRPSRRRTPRRRATVPAPG
jgi:hypothetical protein